MIYFFSDSEVWPDNTVSRSCPFFLFLTKIVPSSQLISSRVRLATSPTRRPANSNSENIAFFLMPAVLLMSMLFRTFFSSVSDSVFGTSSSLYIGAALMYLATSILTCPVIYRYLKNYIGTTILYMFVATSKSRDEFDFFI